MLPGADRAKPGPGDPALAAAKAELRRRLVAARRGMTGADRAAAGRGIRDAVLGLPETQMAGTIAAYCSVGSEPDTRGLLFALWKRGSYVLLPVLLPDGDLDWASYEGPDSLTAGPRGLLEPGPAEPRRGPGAIARADLVLVPALAADRRGHRLGKGGARTTGRWPGSVSWCPPWPCCLTGSCLTRSRLARMTCGYGSPRSRRKESSDWPRGCYHLAVRRGEC